MEGLIPAAPRSFILGRFRDLQKKTVLPETPLRTPSQWGPVHLFDACGLATTLPVVAVVVVGVSQDMWEWIEEEQNSVLMGASA